MADPEQPLGGPGGLGGPGPLGGPSPDVGGSDVTFPIDLAELVYEGQPISFRNTLVVAPAQIAVEGQAISFREDAAIEPAEIAVEGQDVATNLTFSLEHAELAIEGQHIDLSTPKMPLDHAEIAVEGQAIFFQQTVAISHAELAVEGQPISFDGMLGLGAAQIAVEGQPIFFGYGFSLEAAEIAVEGQYFIAQVKAYISPAILVYQGGEIAFRLTVRPQQDRYYYCGRTGFRVPLGDLVEDGVVKGLYVSKGWEDEPHPQDYLPEIGPDGSPGDARAASQDPAEEYDPVILVVDGQEIEV